MKKRFLYSLRVLGIVTTSFGLAAASLFVADFDKYFGEPETVMGATCPWSDNDGNDNDATVGLFEFKAGTYNVSSASTVYDCTNSATSITTFTIPTGVTLVMQGDTTTGTGSGDIAEVNFTNLTINSGGTITADLKGCQGFAADHGDAPNGSNVCINNGSGAGGGGSFGAGGSAAHGGAPGSTGTSPGIVYGSATAPVLFGSSGGGMNNSTVGGHGGGVIRIDVSGTLTHNGVMTSDGEAGDGYCCQNSSSGSGSGGSIYITAGTMNGSTGTFGAIGGNGVDSFADTSGGGGGRMVVVFLSCMAAAAFLLTHLISMSQVEMVVHCNQTALKEQCT